jgi:hypothetical protein
VLGLVRFGQCIRGTSAKSNALSQRENFVATKYSGTLELCRVCNPGHGCSHRTGGALTRTSSIADCSWSFRVIAAENSPARSTIRARPSDMAIRFGGLKFRGKHNPPPGCVSWHFYSQIQPAGCRRLQRTSGQPSTFSRRVCARGLRQYPHAPPGRLTFQAPPLTRRNLSTADGPATARRRWVSSSGAAPQCLVTRGWRAGTVQLRLPGRGLRQSQV